MTDLASSTAQAADLHTSSDARARLKSRYRKEATFKYVGLSAVPAAVLFLVLLLGTIISNAYQAFTYNYATLPVKLEQADIDPDGTGDPEVIGRADFGTIARNAMRELMPFASGRRDRRTLYRLMTSDMGIQIRQAVLDDPSLIGTTANIPVQVDDVGDLYFKGNVTTRDPLPVSGIATPNGTEGTVTVLSTANDFSPLLDVINENITASIGRLELSVSAKERSRVRLQGQVAAMKERIASETGDEKARLERSLVGLNNELQSAIAQIERDTNQVNALTARKDAIGNDEPLTGEMPSFLLRINGGVIKLAKVSATAVEGDVLIPLKDIADAEAGEWVLEMLPKPEGNRKLTDKEIVWLDHLAEQGLVERTINSVFFTAGASREPEQAGILGAVMGSIYTMIVTLLLSFPIGVAAAIYLEEFAPKNLFTKWIEVNINNLAAVPSIVFGLLGLAVFLNVFGFPRSAPLVGGMVLALMTLPTIIIASRAALRSVPPSIREAALGVGASPLQVVTHHVLPLAMPGILTGTIIGMAQALGETAPLLMIGMVAFIVDIPGGPLDPSTVLPVQIFMWADFPEPAFQQKTSAAILVLLAFLVAMNAIAVILRKRFERRW
ncbi:MAG: phosphate ABC transporter permease PstA [Pseudomonadota bacterium]